GSVQTSAPGGQVPWAVATQVWDWQTPLQQSPFARQSAPGAAQAAPQTPPLRGGGPEPGPPAHAGAALVVGPAGLAGRLAGLAGRPAQAREGEQAARGGAGEGPHDGATAVGPGHGPRQTVEGAVVHDRVSSHASERPGVSPLRRRYARGGGTPG